MEKGSKKKRTLQRIREPKDSVGKNPETETFISEHCLEKGKWFFSMPSRSGLSLVALIQSYFLKKSSCLEHFSGAKHDLNIPAKLKNRVRNNLTSKQKWKKSYFKINLSLCKNRAIALEGLVSQLKKIVFFLFFNWGERVTKIWFTCYKFKRTFIFGNNFIKLGRCFCLKNGRVFKEKGWRFSFLG